jgi:hypothetical protein
MTAYRSYARQAAAATMLTACGGQDMLCCVLQCGDRPHPLDRTAEAVSPMASVSVEAPEQTEEPRTAALKERATPGGAG